MRSGPTHAPLDSLRQLNGCALTAWTSSDTASTVCCGVSGHVPQHSMAHALGFVALAARRRPPGSLASPDSPVRRALGGSALLNPFVGGIFALVGRRVRCGRAPSHRSGHAVAAIPVALAFLWCISNGMVDGAGSALQFGPDEFSRHSPFLTYALSLGPLTIAAIAGLIASGPSVPPRTRVLSAVVLAIVSVFLMYFVSLNVDLEWVPFRAGQMLIGALAFLAARWFAAAASPAGARTAIAGGLIVFALGLPTTAIDFYNARDIWNEQEGPSSRWTLVLSPAQQNAFTWIRQNTPRTAVVQMEPIVRQRDSWSLIPSFAQRGMAAGLPISLLRIPDYEAKSEEVRTVFATSDAEEASRIAHSLHIRYLYVDATDRAAYAGTAKFDDSPQFFEPVFRQAGVGIYRVR